MNFTLYCDSLVNPIIVDRAPRLSWKVGTDPASVTTGVTGGFAQTAYKICVATSREKLPTFGAAERFCRTKVWTLSCRRS